MKKNNLIQSLKKTTLTLLFFFSMSLLLQGCHYDRKTSHQKNELVVAIYNDPLSLDPRLVTLSRDLSLMKNTYEGLFRETSSEIQPALVEKYSVSEDGLTYTFFLKDSLWSNKEPVTAYDFELALKQAHTSEVVPTCISLLYAIKNSKAIRQKEASLSDLGIKAIDAKTLQIMLEKPLPHFTSLLTHPVFFPVHKSLRDKLTPKDENVFISNGPFIISKYHMQNVLELSKNPHYWASDKVQLQKVTFQVFPDSYTAHKLFEQKVIHWEGSPWNIPIPVEPSKKLEREAPQTLYSFPVMGTAILICNINKYPISHPSLRKALAYAIDNEAITSIAGIGNTPASSFLPPGLSYLDATKISPNNLSKEERIELAKKYFEEAKKDLSEKDLESLSIIYPMESKLFGLVIQEIQQQWKTILNFHVPIIGTEYHSFIEKRKHGNYFIASGGWIAEYPHPLSFLSILGDPMGKSSAGQISGWKNNSFNSLLDRLYSAENENFKSDVAEAEKVILDDYPIIPLYHYGYSYAINIPLKGLYASPLGTLDLKQAWIEKDN